MFQKDDEGFYITSKKCRRKGSRHCSVRIQFLSLVRLTLAVVLFFEFIDQLDH